MLHTDFCVAGDLGSGVYRSVMLPGREKEYINVGSLAKVREVEGKFKILTKGESN